MHKMFALVVAVLVSTSAHGDEREKAASPFRNDLSKFYLREAAEYDFKLLGQERQSLALEPTPIMKWANSNITAGDVFVWVHRGRPEVVGCIYSKALDGHRREVRHEFHSMASTQLVTAPLPNRPLWTPRAGGIQLTPVPGAAQPANSATQRGSQLRRLAREFTAHMDERDKTWELRLLPRPIYRYSPQESVSFDGALFAYVWDIGTDPEVMLAIEARHSASGPRWNYGVIRFTNRTFWLKHQGKEIYRSARLRSNTKGSQPVDRSFVWYTTKIVSRDAVRESGEKPPD